MKVTAGKSVCVCECVAVGKQAFAVSVRNDSNHTQQKTKFSNGQKEKQTTQRTETSLMAFLRTVSKASVCGV